MPCQKRGRSYLYDPELISKWLLDNGHAVKESVWVQKYSEVAGHLGVKQPAAISWRANDETFPYYKDMQGPWCIDIIRKWHIEEKLPRHGRGGPLSTASKSGKEIAPQKKSRLEELQEAYQEERLEHRRIANDERRKLLVPIGEVRDRLSRATGVIAQMLDEQIGLIMSKLPTTIDAQSKRRIESSLRSQTKVIKRMFAEALREDSNPEEELYGKEEELEEEDS